jgi:hypothetical protein
VAAVGLTAVFAAAATAKLVDPPSTARGLRNLGLPAPYRLARLVPSVEVAVAVALALVPAVGAAAALVLLAAFSVLIAQRLAVGVHAPCACFGGGGGPLSWRHLVRNAVLGLSAVVVLLGAEGWWAGWAWGCVATAGGLLAAGTLVLRDRAR